MRRASPSSSGSGSPRRPATTTRICTWAGGGSRSSGPRTAQAGSPRSTPSWPSGPTPWPASAMSGGDHDGGGDPQAACPEGGAVLLARLGIAGELAHLDGALTHPSFANEQRGRCADNQRLEFLGDAVLGLLV